MAGKSGWPLMEGLTYCSGAMITGTIFIKEHITDITTTVKYSLSTVRCSHLGDMDFGESMAKSLSSCQRKESGRSYRSPKCCHLELDI